MPLTSHIVTISENGFVRSNKKRSKVHFCYETKKCEKRFPYILVKGHYFISLQQERERHMTWKSHDITS